MRLQQMIIDACCVGAADLLVRNGHTWSQEQTHQIEGGNGVEWIRIWLPVRLRPYMYRVVRLEPTIEPIGFCLRWKTRLFFLTNGLPYLKYTE